MPTLARILLVGVLIAAGTTCSDPIPVGPRGPPSLSIFSGNHSFGVTLGDTMQVAVTLTGPHGDLLPVPPSFSFLSRDPSVITVDSERMMHANGMGETWVVGSLDFEGQRLADSIHVFVMCTLELGWSITPTQDTLRVGDSFTPAVTFTTCGGRLHPSDTLRWSAADTAIVQVDSITGRTTGRSPGETAVQFRALRFQVKGGLPVTVIGPAP